MKKGIVLAALAVFAVLAPFAVSAQDVLGSQSAIGLTAFYRDPTWFDDGPEFEGATIGDYAIGPEWRLNAGFLQLDALALVTPRDPVILDAYLLGGLVLNLGFLQLSGDIGPHLAYDADTEELDLLFGAKASLDVVLGRVSVGVSYIADLTLEDGLDRRPESGFLGVSLLFGW